MKILFLTSNLEDYLSDGLLIGLRELYGTDCVDYPKQDILYDDCPSMILEQVRGHGFTLYSGSLPNVDVDRANIKMKLESGFFDLVIFSDIWRQYGYFTQWRPLLNPNKTIILDGQDTAQVYPYAGLWWRRFSQWFAPRAHKNFLYFKREWTADSQFNFWHRFVPKGLLRYLPICKNLRKVSFSIPESKILGEVPNKTKDFARHCVDGQVAERISECVESYAFKNEGAYYADLQASRFGVTIKRAGWDCLRHYEIAANGCIPCFRDLDRKPKTCAPHGLEDLVNCISYSSVDDLMVKIQNLSLDQELALRQGALNWAKFYSCRNLARRILQEVMP